MALQLTPPFEALRTVALDIPREAELPDSFWSSLPTEAAVVLFEDENGRPVLIRGIGDPRAFVRRRLQPETNDPSPRTDYKAVCRRVSIIPTGHTLLAELLGAWCEASLDEELARTTGARLSMCIVLCDPSARLPMFRCVEWSELWLGTIRPTRHERFIGPFSNPKRAKRWIELVIDLFDLCRYDHLLAQTPDATPCVYKQMGKCPAPCDGSEPLESYRARFAKAAQFVDRAVTAELSHCEQGMHAAASKLDFEQAAEHKERLRTIQSMHSGGPWQVCDLNEIVWEIIGPANKASWHRRSSLDLNGLFLNADQHEKGHGGPSVSNRTPLIHGRTVWLLLATLTEYLQKGLASDERVEQTVRESVVTR
ncbi:MAG: UvrB/UvrC motif-containing protein [Phycisphaerales bacterium JB065]